jgi:hypothetical protein
MALGSKGNEYQEYFLGGLRQPVCRADNITAFNVLKSRSLKLLDPSEFVQACTGIALLSNIKIN